MVPLVGCRRKRPAEGGPVHHVPVSPAHAAGGVGVLDHGFQVALVQQGQAAGLVGRRPAVGLAGKGNGGFDGHIGVRLTQVEDRLAEVKVRPLGHAAEKVTVPVVIRCCQGAGQAGLQRQAAGVGFIAAPGQAGRAVAGETAGGLWRHGELLSGGRCPLALWYTAGCGKSTKNLARIWLGLGSFWG